MSTPSTLEGELPKELARPKRKTVGAADVPLVFVAPRRLFARVEDVAAYAWPLTILLTAVTLIGYATVETGLINRQVDRQKNEAKAEIERTQTDVVSQAELSRLLEDADKAAEFMKLLARTQVILIRPISALASAMLIAAVFYGLVAMTGRKPEWNTLLTITVFASFIDVLGLLFRLILMMAYKTLDVHTSLAVLVDKMGWSETMDSTGAAALRGALSAFDPFVIWFWIIVMIGVTTVRQMGRVGAIVTVSLFWLIAAGGKTGMAVAAMGAGT